MFLYVCAHVCSPADFLICVCDTVTNLHYRAHLLTCGEEGGGGAEKITIDIAMVTVTLLFAATHIAVCVCVSGGCCFLWGLDVLFQRCSRRLNG